MHDYNYPLSDRLNWFFDSSGDLRKEDGNAKFDNLESERRFVENSVATEQNKREVDRKAKRYTSKELVASLPECKRCPKTIDEIVHEGLIIIDLLDNV